MVNVFWPHFGMYIECIQSVRSNVFWRCSECNLSISLFQLKYMLNTCLVYAWCTCECILMHVQFVASVFLMFVECISNVFAVCLECIESSFKVTVWQQTVNLESLQSSKESRRTHTRPIKQHKLAKKHDVIPRQLWMLLKLFLTVMHDKVN